MKKKGFTLIELLAVIVILGIITVVAVPKILDVINKSKESATSSSIKLVKDAIKTQIASSDLTGPVFTKETDGCYLFDFDDQESGNAKVLEIKNKDRVSGSIKYCNNAFSDDTLKFDGNSISKDEPKGKIICKRATTLHTEKCTQTDGSMFCSGAGYTTSGSKGISTITYGNIGNKGVLTSGDAFDCDVNGDEVYNPETERFYYVSDYYNTNTKSFESETAVLLYYSNVSAGVAKDSSYVYDSSGNNYYGPRTAIAQLPTINQWSNVSLKNTARAIISHNDGNTTLNNISLPDNFDYSKYSTRLIAFQEIKEGCNNSIATWKAGELDNCNYLFENTRYSGVNGYWGYWLENPFIGTLDGHAWYAEGDGRYISILPVSTTSPVGVRPVIEVSKKNIDY
ncbi:MAG: type II secretion system protein [Bacilli bacterium]|nr:type II secretion system protein [Bacilli bacterium]